MKKKISPFLFAILVGFLINHFIEEQDLGERVSLSKDSLEVISEQTKFNKIGYAERNILLNESSSLKARKEEFNFETPCSREDFSTLDSVSFATYNKQALTAFFDPIAAEKLVSTQKIINNMRIILDDLSLTDIDSKLITISENIKELVIIQNYFAQEVLKKIPANNDFSYVIAQRTIKDTIPIELPLNILIFCKEHINSGCDSIRNQMKKAVDSDSLLFANNIDKNIYFSNTEGQDNIEFDLAVCRTDINASKMALQNRFSELYAQKIKDNLNSASISPLTF